MCIRDRLGSWSAVAKLIGLSSPSRLRQRRIPLKAAFKAWCEAGAFPDDIAVSDRFGSCEFKVLRTVLNPRFADLIGYYIADGHMDHGRCVISLRNPMRLRDVIWAAEGLDFNPHIFYKSGGRVPRVTLPVAPSAIIESLGCGRGAGSKSLPSIYWRMPRKWRSRLLRAYFGSDGGVEGSGEVHAATKSYLLSRQLMIALLEYGIHARRRKRIVNGETYYELTISSYFAEEFLNNIGFTQTGKTMELKRRISGRSSLWSKYHVVPNPLLKKHMSEVKILARRGYRFFDKNVMEGYAASKKNLLRTLRRLDPNRELRGLWKLAEDNILWIPVKHIQECRINGYVYDFSTPTETFLAGDGIVVHNTTTANCILTMIDPNLKIATIEDTPELRIPHKSWQRFKSRMSYSITESKFDVDLMDLVKLSLRYRPDYIVVGEVRGEEIRALIQAAALGHGCLCTFHSESPEAALVRMRSPPMNVGEGGLMLIWCFVQLTRTKDEHGKVVRRVLEVVEVVPGEDRLELKRVFTWDARTDAFEPADAGEVVRRSRRLKTVMRLTGWTEEELAEELGKRAEYLKKIVDENKLSYPEFSEAIRRFYVMRRKGKI